MAASFRKLSVGMPGSEASREVGGSSHVPSQRCSGESGEGHPATLAPMLRAVFRAAVDDAFNDLLPADGPTSPRCNLSQIAQADLGLVGV